MKYIAFVLLLAPLCVLSGCGIQTDTSQQPVDPVPEIQQTRPLYLGVWERLSTYVDDLLVSNAPATLELTEGSFHSENDLCWSSGDLIVDAQMLMTITDGDCPVVPGAETIVYKDEFSDDGKKMTITTVYEGVKIVEEYQRVE